LVQTWKRMRRRNQSKRRNRMKRFTRDDTEHGQEYYLASDVDKALAQPAQEPWCMKMNRCTTKCEDCPDEPAQEPVGVFCEDDDIGYVRLIPHQQMKLKAWDKLYTAPQQRPWVGLTEAQFLEATRLAENGNYLVAFVRIQEWLKEQNT